MKITLFGVPVEVLPEAEIVSRGFPHVCVRKADAAVIVPGSTVMTCSLCAIEILVAPSGQRLQAFGKNPLVCLQCAEATSRGAA